MTVVRSEAPTFDKSLRRLLRHAQTRLAKRWHTHRSSPRVLEELERLLYRELADRLLARDRRAAASRRAATRRARLGRRRLARRRKPRAPRERGAA